MSLRNKRNSLIYINFIYINLLPYINYLLPYLVEKLEAWTNYILLHFTTIFTTFTTFTTLEAWTNYIYIMYYM